MKNKVLKKGITVLVQSEHDHTRFYTVIFGETRKDDRCNCLGVRQYLGQKKNGEPKYRDQKTSCFHIRWAREYYQDGVQVLTCGTQPFEVTGFIEMKKEDKA